MKQLGKLVALTALALAFTGTTAAQADPGINANLVDGTISVSDITCTWTNGSTSDNPLNMLTVYRNTINPPGGNNACTGAQNVTLDNDPKVTFGAGTATVDRVRVTGTQFGITCTYEATNVVSSQVGTAQRYTASFTASRVSGDPFFCPSTRPGTSDVTFH